MRNNFLLASSDEPHAVRRKKILEKHPEIETLFGNDPTPVPYVIALVVSQLLIAYFQQSWSWWFFFVVAW